MTYNTAVKNFINDLYQNGCELHQLTVYKNGEKIFSDAPVPYSTCQKNHVFSLSKSFCSTAVGIACDKGLLSLDERIIDIFPDKCPENISENLSKMTLLNVLSMNTGHSACVMNAMMTAEDPVKAFLACNVEFAPGTHFAYNTGATCLAGACLTKRSGLSVLEFLEINLFRHMDIKGSKWLSHKGLSEGGVGFYTTSEDAAKLGMLYLNGGKWNGKQLISEKYVKLASSFISDNSGNGNPDWCAGYGLQFWMNAKGGFRGDGAYGQLCMVFPEKNIVIGLIGDAGAMQPEIDCVYRFVDELACANGCGEDISEFLTDFYKPSDFCSDNFTLCGKAFELDENICSFSHVLFDKNEECGIDISIISGTDTVNLIKLVPGKWTKGILCGKEVKPTLAGLTATHDDALEFAASVNDIGSNSISVTLRGTNCPHNATYCFEASDGCLKITRTCLHKPDYTYEFCGKEI